MMQPPSSQRPSVRSLDLPAPAIGAWLWLAEDTERVLDAARPATGAACSLTLVRILENGAEVDYVVGHGEVRSPFLRVVDAACSPLAARLERAVEGSELVARDGASVVGGTVIFRHRLELDGEGRLVAIDTSEGRLEKRANGRWKLLPRRDDPAPNSRRGGGRIAA